MYIQYQNDQFILPFSVNCSQVAMFQIIPAFCPHGQEEGVVNQMWTGLDKGRGIPKIPKFVRTSFMDDPYVKSVCHLIVTNTIYLTYEKIINFLWHKFQKSLNEILQNYKDNIILHYARLKS